MKKLFMLTIVLSVATIASAGDIRKFTCSDEACNFTAEVYSGRGKASIHVPGYCKQCKRMVTVTFRNRDMKDGKPVPLAQAWDSTTGRTLDLHACPHCRKPFSGMTRMIFCPTCGKKSIAESIVGKWD